jgi:hypothetical protein
MAKQYSAPDDDPVYVFKRDISGGMNTRQQASIIEDNQATLLQNIFLETAGQTTLRTGQTRIDSSYPSGAASGYGLFGFNPDGGIFNLMAMQGGALSGWPSTGSFVSRISGFTDGLPCNMIKAGQQAQLDVLIVGNGTDNSFVMYQDYSYHDLLDTVYSMPKTKAFTYYGNRVWALKNNLVAFSDAFPATYYPTPAKLIGDQTTYTYTTADKIKVTIDGTIYDDISLAACSSISDVVTAINTAVGSTVASIGAYPDPVGVLVISGILVGTASTAIIADGTSMTSAVPVKTCIAKLFFTATKSVYGYAPFDRVTNAFRVPVGEAQAILGTRDQGLILLGSDQIWQLAPSQIPSPSTDIPQRVLEMGCVAGLTAVQGADDIYFLAPDGVRGLFRTQLDKLQAGQSFPLSYVLQDEFNAINWSQISKACAIYFDNKYIISLPINGMSYNNICWVYYPALKAWAIYEGWEIASFAVMNIAGKPTLLGIDSVTGQVYKLFVGTSDNGSAIVYDSKSKAEDFKAPLQYKYGGEVKIRAKGGSGIVVVSVNPDNAGWTQLGSFSLAITGITFPVTFPVIFAAMAEAQGIFHLDSSGIMKFKRLQHREVCSTLDADLTILETLCTAFTEPYLSEEQ